MPVWCVESRVLLIDAIISVVIAPLAGLGYHSVRGCQVHLHAYPKCKRLHFVEGLDVASLHPFSTKALCHLHHARNVFGTSFGTKGWHHRFSHFGMLLPMQDA